MATSNLDRTFLQGAIESFQKILAPISAFYYAVSQQGAALNDTITVPYVSAATGSSNFSYATGYATDSADVTGKSITLNTIKYQKASLTDADMAALNPEAISRLGNQLGARLAGDVLSASFAAVLTDANFPLSSSWNTNELSSSSTLIDLTEQADAQNWPVERNLILTSTANGYLLSNTNIVNASVFGSSQPVQTSNIPNVFGFQVFKTTVPMVVPIALNPNAILLGMAPHLPPSEAGNIVRVEQASWDGGLTLVMRTYYDPNYATTRKVIDCLFGVATGDSTALIQLKA